MYTKIYIDAIEKELALCCDEYFYKKSSVADAARYSLLNAGKRIRAILLFMTAEMCGKDWRKYLRLASAVEMIHCYSLIHDDLPCMDNDDMRRGKPSCHKAFGEDTALLAGDALIGLGLETIVNDENIDDLSKIKAMKAITRAMGPMGMIYGQELDLEYEDKVADKIILDTIHRHKTGRMISLCGILGSIDSKLTENQKNALELFFDNIGLVFQIVDDILDVEGDQRQLGKPVGSDSENNKSTFITLYGLQQSKVIANNLTQQANEALSAAFGDKSQALIKYTSYLLERKN